MAKFLRKLVLFFALTFTAAVACRGWALAANLNPDSMLRVGQTWQLKSSLNDPTWSCEDTDVLRVDENGKATAVGVGYAKVFAQSGNKRTSQSFYIRANSNAPLWQSLDGLSDVLTSKAKSGSTRYTFIYQDSSLRAEQSEVEQLLLDLWKHPAYVYMINMRYLDFELQNGGHRIEATCSFSYTPSAKVARVYAGENLTLNKKEKALKSACDVIINKYLLKSSETKDWQKVVLLHDYLVSNGAYDKEASTSNIDTKLEKYMDSYSAYGLLVKGKGTCIAYAESMKLILNVVGIECDYLVGMTKDGIETQTENHVWNRVKLDGSWYHVDATWDDPVPDQEGEVRYDYLFLTDDEMSKTHNWTDHSHICNSNTFSDRSFLK